MPERPHWRRSGIFIINFWHISHLALVFLLFNFDHVIAGWATYGERPIDLKGKSTDSPRRCI